MRCMILATLCVVVAANIAVADGTVQGEARFEVVKGRPGNYKLLHEWKLFMSPDDGTRTGYWRMIGPNCQLTCGWYSITAPADFYTILVTRSMNYARPYVVRDVQIVNGQTQTLNLECPKDYSCYWMENNEWSWGTPRYQTFLATGTSVNRIQWMLAGSTASKVQVSVHEDNGGLITTWPQIGPAKSCNVGTGDSWVGFRSGDIPTTPHHRYALKFQGVGGDFGIRHRTEDGNGYAGGQAFDASGNPQNVDLHATVFSDCDGTVIPYTGMTPRKPVVYGPNSGTWGQTFKATSVSLASADCYGAGPAADNVRCEWRIKEGGPTGAQIGPTKTGGAVYDPPFVVGVSYAPGEVPLVPGNTYFVEMKAAPGAPEFNVYLFADKADNAYPYGDAYWNGIKQTNEDLEMTIIEYKQWYSPTVVNPSFEDYGGYLDGWEITKTDGKGPDDPPHDNTNPYGPRTTFGSHFAGKITSGQSMDFTLGQVIETADYPVGMTEVNYALTANVQMHARTSTPQPALVHQVWELGWNNDGSMPIGINRCDNYTTIGSVNGNFTGNDMTNFYPLNLNGSITSAAHLEGVVVRVRLYNDTPMNWTMNNIDNVALLIPPPGPGIILNPTSFEPTVWVGNSPNADAFTVANDNPELMTYQITDDAPWLSVEPVSGSSSGEADTINVFYNGVNSMLAGTYEATITVTSPQAWNSPQDLPVTLTIETVTPDFDGDADVDLDDFGHLQICFSGPGVDQDDPDCADALLDEDDDVDQDDFIILKGCLSGAGNPAIPTCDD